MEKWLFLVHATRLVVQWSWKFLSLSSALSILLHDISLEKYQYHIFHEKCRTPSNTFDNS